MPLGQKWGSFLPVVGLDAALWVPKEVRFSCERGPHVIGDLGSVMALPSHSSEGCGHGEKGGAAVPQPLLLWLCWNVARAPTCSVFLVCFLFSFLFVFYFRGSPELETSSDFFFFWEKLLTCRF